MVASVDFGILGPLRIQIAGALVNIQAAKQRIVAAALILRANKHVGIDELAEFLWDDRPPPGARGAVQAYVMRLRGALGDRAAHGLIRTVGGGYLLEAPPEAVDLIRFQRLVHVAERSAAAAQLSAASQQFGAALSLWRGPPLSDVESEWLRRGEVPMLAEQRLLASERRIEIELALGHHKQVIPELRALVGEHPLRERYWYLLMLALLQSGQRGEALAAYRRIWRLLRSELGVEPGGALRELHLRVLSGEPVAGADGRVICGQRGLPAMNARDGHTNRGDRTLDSPGFPLYVRPPRSRGPARWRARATNPSAPRARIEAGTADDRSAWVKQCQLPRDTGDFIGRVVAVEQIAKVLTSREPPVPIVALSGLPGVGKTALAIRVAHRIRAEFPDGQLYVKLTGIDGRPRSAARVLADLLLATGLDRNLIPDGPDQRSAVYRARIADRRILVVLDDAAGAVQVRPLLPGTPGCAVLITSRGDLRGLAALDNTVSYVLSVLEPSEALALLTRKLGADRVSAEPTAAAELAAACGFLPLALRIAATNLVNWPTQTLSSCVADLRTGNRVTKLAVAGDPVATLQTAFDVLYAALDPASRQFFGLLSQLPRPDFTVNEVATTFRMDASRAARLLDELAAAGVIRRRASGWFEFHDLLRIYAASKAAEFSGRAQRSAHGDAPRHGRPDRVYDD